MSDLKICPSIRSDNNIIFKIEKNTKLYKFSLLFICEIHPTLIIILK